MSNVIDHINLANKNQLTLNLLLKENGEHSEWVATIAFYKAVHVVEAVFAVGGIHSNSHDSRLSSLKLSKYQQIFKAYRPLYAASLVARYLADSARPKLEGKPVKHYSCFSDYMAPEDVEPRLIRKRLKTVEDNAVSFLSQDQRSALIRVQS